MKAHRMDQETAERLLGGTVVESRDGREPLTALLTAVRAAPRPVELRGENAAMHAFRNARAGAPLPVPARAGRPAALARFAGLKVALAALVVAGTGGVALAAATGTLPAPLHRPDDRPVGPAVVPGDRVSPTDHSGPAGTPSSPESGRPAPSGSILGLCRAYRAGAGDNPGRTLDNPVFSDLIHSAGGREKVPGYCDQVIDEPAKPGRPGTPTTGRPESSARPDARPSHTPTTTPDRPATPAQATPTPPTPSKR